MLKVAIYAPYTRSEGTFTAIMLAGWCLRLGIDVEWMHTGDRARSLHPHWDNNVFPMTLDSVARWLRGSTHRLWLEHNTQLMSLAAGRNTGEHKRDIRLLPWQLGTPDRATGTDNAALGYLQSLGFRLLHTQVSATIRDWALSSLAETGATMLPVALCHADVTLKPKAGFRRGGARRLLVLLPHSRSLTAMAELLPAMDYVMAKQPDLTVAWVKSLGPSHVTAAAESYRSRAVYADRMELLTVSNYDEHLSQLMEADWAYLPRFKQHYGAVHALVQGRGTPLIYHDVGQPAAVSGGYSIPATVSDAGKALSLPAADELGRSLANVVASNESELISRQRKDFKLFQQQQQDMADYFVTGLLQ